MGVQPETVLQNQIRLAIGANCPGCTIFRNHCGALKDARTGRLVTFGLSPGSPDLIGWKTIIVTPEMVGSSLAVFCGIEIKTPKGVVRADQQHWLNRLGVSGGISGVARSIDDVLQLLDS